MSDKVPPHSKEAEQSTLGSMLLDEEAIITAEMMLKANDFYWKSHSVIFKAVTDIFNDQEPVDLVTVNEKLRNEDKLEDIGGASYITSLVNSVPTAANIEHYAGIVKEKSKLRQLIQASSKINKLSYESGEATEVVERAEQLIFNITDSKATNEVYDLSEELLDHVDRIEQRLENEGIRGLETKWGRINKATAGLQDGDLVLIAARPSMGKTALAINQAVFSAENEKKVAIASAEMKKEKLIDRIFAYKSGVNGLKLKNGNLTENDSKRITQAASNLGTANLKIIDNNVKDITEIKSLARQIKRQDGLDLLMVDFLQLLRGFEDEQSRNRQVGRQAKAFKNLAGELDIPIILLSQLNRSVEQRNNKRPQMSDLRDSGEVEEVADIIMMLYRDEYYNADTEKQGILEVNLAKNRDGRTGTVELMFQKEKQKIESLSRRGE